MITVFFRHVQVRSRRRFTLKSGPSKVFDGLDTFMPEHEVAERLRVGIDAPPEITYFAAGDMRLQQSAIVRRIIKILGLTLRSNPSRWFARTARRIMANVDSAWKVRSWILAKQPSGGVAEVQDLDGAILLLASGVSDYFNRQMIFVDGASATGWMGPE